MKMTRPLPDDDKFNSAPASARSNRSRGSEAPSARGSKPPTPFAGDLSLKTDALRQGTGSASARSGGASSRRSASARSRASERSDILKAIQKEVRGGDAERAKKIEELLAIKEEEILKLKDELARTKGS